MRAPWNLLLLLSTTLQTVYSLKCHTCTHTEVSTGDEALDETMNKAGEKEGIYNIKCADVSETKTTSCTKGCMEGYVVATKMNEHTSEEMTVTTLTKGCSTESFNGDEACESDPEKVGYVDGEGTLEGMEVKRVGYCACNTADFCNNHTKDVLQGMAGAVCLNPSLVLTLITGLLLSLYSTPAWC